MIGAVSRLDRPCGEHCNRSICSPTRCYGRIPYDELPCREFCQSYRHGCAKGRCSNPYPKDDPRHWLGRGSEDVPGQSFGWAHNMEREAIRAHLLASGRPDGIATYFLISKIQRRLQRDYHRRKPKVGVRRAPIDFTAAELLRIAERFEGANDAEGQEIARKARELAER
jgi:hypothetical protein